jgi:hypothetical protein
MRIHGVTTVFIREATALGYNHPGIHQPATIGSTEYRPNTFARLALRFEAIFPSISS